MKKLSPISARRFSTIGRLSALSLALFTFQTVQGTTLYWDVNGTTAGSGGTITGTWNGTLQNWNTDATGGAAGSLSGLTTASDNVVFSAGSDAVPGTVTLTGTQYAQGVELTTSGYTLSGATAKLFIGQDGLKVDAGSTTTNITTQIVYTTSQTWTNNSTGILQFNTSVATDASVSTPITLTLAGSGGYAAISSASFLKDNGSAASLIYSASGQFQIKGVNNFSGGTTFKKGTLRLENNTGLGTGAITFDVSEGGAPILTTNVTGGATIANNIIYASGGTGSATITTVNSTAATYTGAFTLNNSGTANNLNIIGVGGPSITINGKITGTGGITKTGTSTLILSNASNDFQGGLILNHALSVLQLTADGALGSGALTLNAGTVESNDSARTISNALGTIGGNVTFGSTTAGATGALNFTNTTTAALATSSTATRSFTINSDTTFANGFSGNASTPNAASGLTKQGSATMTMRGESTYTGLTTVSAGTLQVGDDVSGSIASGTVSVASGATLAFKQANGTSYGGAISNAGTVKGLASGTNTLSGAITGGGGFTQAGTGVTILTGSNSYTGATSVTGGRLVVDALGSLGTTGVSVDAAGSLTVNGAVGGNVTSYGNVNGAGSVAGSLVIVTGTLAPGDGIGSLKADGGLTVQTGALVSMQLDSLSSYDQIVAKGTVSLAGALDLSLGSEIAVGNVFKLIDGDGSSIQGSFGTITVGGASVTITASTATTTDFTFDGKAYEINYADAGNDMTLSALAVPEPGTWAMIASGFGCLVGLQRLRRKVS